MACVAQGELRLSPKGGGLTDPPSLPARPLSTASHPQVYQIYAKRPPGDVHALLRSFGADYVILEDSICYERRHRPGCRLRDLLDLANGHVSMHLRPVAVCPPSGHRT